MIQRVERQPVPLRQTPAGERRPSLCELRGHCGPFVNQALYNAFPEPMWHDMGDCVECGTTCHVRSHLEAMAAAQPTAA